MKDLTVFKHEEFGEVRIIDQNDSPWFVAKDVCVVLELNNTTEAVRGLDDDEKQQLDSNIINPEVGGRGTLIINESGLYSLILRSRKPEAKRFKKWVTSEVLPSIRKTGSYSIQLSPAQMLLAQAQQLVDMERMQSEQAKQIDKVATRLDQIETSSEFFTVLGYNRLMRKESLPIDEARRHGVKLTRICSQRKIRMGKVPDPRFGEINSYPKFLLDEYFSEACDMLPFVKTA